MIVPNSVTSLQGWLQWLEKLHPSTIDLGLERVSEVASRLALNFPRSRIITIGGTNGKGSTLAMLAALLQAKGATVGSYTSPHLLSYNERVCLNGKQATDEALRQAFLAVETVRQDVSLTYFEYGTLAALYLFSAWQPEFILLEVGLGGRLDAVNIVDPDISILTNVQFDHMDWLGDTRDAIAMEKSGIFRAGRPAIYGERDMPEVIQQKAAIGKVALYALGRDFDWVLAENSWNWQGRDTKGREVVLNAIPPIGFPLDNAACAIQALHLLQSVPDDEQIRKVLTAVTLPGRFQPVCYRGRRVVLDVAHNPHAAGQLVCNIQAAGGQARVVLGMLSDKDIAGVLKVLAPATSALYAATLVGERGAQAEIIYNYALETGISPVSSHGNVISAVDAALAEASSDETVVVTGSFFTVAAVLERI